MKTFFSTRFGFRTSMQRVKQVTPLPIRPGIMENLLFDLANRSTLVPDRIKPGTYVAVVDASCELTTGVDAPVLEEGLNVILGDW